LLGAAGKYDEAVAMYQSIVSNGRRPELEQAIGELCDLVGQSGPAAYWKQRALTAYLQSAQRGEVHYYHHLVDYYTDVAECGAEAVKWAYEDLQLRENFATRQPLPGRYRDGRSAKRSTGLSVLWRQALSMHCWIFAPVRSTGRPATRLKGAIFRNGH
jgi:hypothetical protein